MSEPGIIDADFEDESNLPPQTPALTNLRRRRPIPQPEPADHPDPQTTEPEPVDLSNDEPSEAPPHPDEEDTEDAAGTKPAAKKQRRAGRPRQKPTTTKPRKTTISIPSSMFAKVRNLRVQLSLTNTTLIIDALETTAEQLVQDNQANQEGPSSVGGTRFAPRKPKRPQEEDPEAQVPLTIELSDDDNDAIESLIEDAGARSRNHLIQKALRVYIDRRSGTTAG